MPRASSVAVTGACGRIGRAFAQHLAARQYRVTLIDKAGKDLEELAALGPIIAVDLAEPPDSALFNGVDVIVHLAGEPRPDAPWETLLSDNIKASYHVARAALQSGCRRLIVASSVHAVLASAERPVAPDGAVAPSDLYGVSKCFVEALAFWCAHAGSMSAAAVRIGAFQTVEASHAADASWMSDVFIAGPDLLSLLERAITADYHFAILHATAPGPRVLLDIGATQSLLGWRPQYRFPLGG